MMLASLFSDPGFVIPMTLIQVLGLILLFWLLDVYEREPMAVVAALTFWGATFAVAITIALREPVLRVAGGDDFVRRAMAAALVEEPAKGIALVAAFAISWWGARRFGVLEFEGLTDGAVYGAAVGLGFAFTENLFYLVQQDSLASGLTLLVSRADFGGLSMLGHAVYTGTFGMGLGLATWRSDRTERVMCALGGLALAVIMHATHNGLLAGDNELAARAADYGFVVFFFGAILLWLARQRRILQRVLAEEVALGEITGEQLRLVSGPLALLAHQLRKLRAGEVDQLRAERELHRELVELAFAVDRLRRMGLRGATEPVAARRRRIATLQAQLALARESDRDRRVSVSP